MARGDEPLEDVDDDEVLDTGRAGWSPGRRLGVTVAVLVVVAALLVVAVVRHDASRHVPVAAPTHATQSASASVAPTPSVVRLPTPVLSLGPVRVIAPPPVPQLSTRRGSLPERSGDDPAKCPGLTCTARPTVPGAVVVAVHKAFPGLHIGRVTTVRLARHGRPLWFREVVASGGGRSVQLLIQAHSLSDTTRAYTRIDPAVVVTYVEKDLGQWHVFVTVTATSQQDRTYGQALELAGDQRILAT